MFENLKRMAMQKMAQKMMANKLSEAATSEAATEGSGALMEAIKSKLGAGSLDEVKDLFSSGGQSMEQNGIFQNVQSKMQEILQSKGMSAEEAQAEASNTVPDMVSGLREKFESKEEADKEWDFSQLTNLAGGLGGGNAADLINKAKNLF